MPLASRLVFVFSHDDGVLDVLFGLESDGVAGCTSSPQQPPPSSLSRIVKAISYRWARMSEANEIRIS
jgi:hypothetical protein